jgi:hypothetical protein
VKVGDVGFIHRGYFHRLFNALRPPPSGSNSDGPKYPPRLEPRILDHIHQDKDDPQDFLSRKVQKQLHETLAIG